MRRRSPLLVALTLLALLLAAIGAAACGGGDDGSPTEDAPDPPAVVEESSALATAPTFRTSSAGVARLIIPSIGMDRPTVDGLVDTRTHEMIAPRGPWDVAYYTYSGPPGRGNAVFSGHVDFINVGPAVFWDLRKVAEGDEVIVRLADGLEMRYKVKFNRMYDAETGPWQELFARDAAKDVVTIYTCDGEFDRGSQNYSKRRVVRAERSG
jgi:LPXTG-site transpeptidase (sortase) family protein